MDVFPKFIIEGDSLIIAKCTYHHQLVEDKNNVKGGGWWRLVDDVFILSGSSHDFGAASIEDIKDCVTKDNVFTNKYETRGIDIKYGIAYDTGTEIIKLR